MNTEVIEQAKACGYKTSEELAAFLNGHEMGYYKGQSDTLEEVTKDIKDANFSGVDMDKAKAKRRISNA